MKFLCVVCDTPMKLERAEPPDDGSITAVFECPDCFHQIAMLTNPMETQTLQSLGVGLGRDAAAAAEAGGCPFSGMLKEMEATAASGGVQWTEGALARLQGIPDFVRPMAKQGVEQYALSNGYQEVSEAVMDEARGRFGM